MDLGGFAIIVEYLLIKIKSKEYPRFKTYNIL